MKDVNEELIKLFKQKYNLTEEQSDEIISIVEARIGNRFDDNCVDFDDNCVEMINVDDKLNDEYSGEMNFRSEVMAAMKNKPEKCRDGKFVFNYIEEKYGVAHYVQFTEGVNCYFDDKQIDEFISLCYKNLGNDINDIIFNGYSMKKWLSSNL